MIKVTCAANLSQMRCKYWLLQMPQQAGCLALFSAQVLQEHLFLLATPCLYILAHWVHILEHANVHVDTGMLWLVETDVLAELELRKVFLLACSKLYSYDTSQVMLLLTRA